MPPREIALTQGGSFVFNLLRILRTICDVHPQRQGLIAQYALFDAVEKLVENDKAVLVKATRERDYVARLDGRTVSSTAANPARSLLEVVSRKRRIEMGYIPVME